MGSLRSVQVRIRAANDSYAFLNLEWITFGIHFLCVNKLSHIIFRSINQRTRGWISLQSLQPQLKVCKEELVSEFILRWQQTLVVLVDEWKRQINNRLFSDYLRNVEDLVLQVVGDILLVELLFTRSSSSDDNLGQDELFQVMLDNSASSVALQCFLTTEESLTLVN